MRIGVWWLLMAMVSLILWYGLISLGLLILN